MKKHRKSWHKVAKFIGHKDQWSYPSYDRFVLCCIYQDDDVDKETTTDLLKILVPRKIYPKIRWTDLEIKLFIDELKISGKDYAKISKKVVTKDFEQCRSYAGQLTTKL